MQKSRRNVVKLLSLWGSWSVMTWHTRAGAWTAGQLTVWINADKGHEGLRRVAEAYAQRSGRKVVVQHFEQAVDRFEAVMKEGGQGGPDIWIWPHDRIGDWIQRGWIAPVLPSEPVRSDIVQVAWDGFTQGGKIWGYPLSVEAVALVYNKALVPQPPASFEEVLALHEKLKPQGIRALGWETGSPYFTWPLMAAVGPMSSSVASMAVMSRATPASTIRARCVRGSISSS
jgi:maltose/maltodextrin transport system substrate-binding protein